MARIKLSKAAKDLNVSVSTLVDQLGKHNIQVEDNPNARIDESAYGILLTVYGKDSALKSKIDDIL